MIFSRFFKVARPKKFSYKPIYYNEQKERLQELKKQIAKVNQGEKTEEKVEASRIRQGFEFRRNDKGYSLQRYSGLRIIIIAAVLSLLAYYILK